MSILHSHTRGPFIFASWSRVPDQHEQLVMHLGSISKEGHRAFEPVPVTKRSRDCNHRVKPSLYNEIYSIEVFFYMT